MKSIDREMPLAAERAALPPATLRVLLLEDDRCDAELIAAALNEAEGVTIALTHVETLADARALLASGEYRLTLADLSLLDSKGVETVRRLVDVAPGPVIALTGHDDPAMRAGALAAGAYDFLSKGELRGSTLARVIRLASVQSLTAETLEKTRERHRVLIEHSTDGIALFGRDGTILYGSPATRRMLGYDTGDTAGLSVLELAHPADRARCAAKFSAALARPGVVVTYVARFRHKDGTYRVLDGTLINLLGEPSVAGVVANYRDVTERKRADERLQRLQRMYAALSETSEAILHARTAGALYLQACNVAVAHGGFAIAAVRLLDPVTGNLVPAAVSGECSHWMPFLDASVRVDAANGRGPGGIAAREGRAAFVNDVNADANSQHWLKAAHASRIASSASVPIRRRGAVVGILSVFAHEAGYFDDELIRLLERMADNVSFALDGFDRGAERESAETALRESEARFRTVIESLNEGILVYDRDHLVVAGNAMAARLIGCPLAEMIGKPGFTSLFPCVNEDGTPLAPEDRPTRVTVRTGSEQSDRILGIRRPDGATTWLSINTAFLRHPGANEHYGLVSTISDITKRREAQIALRASEDRFRRLIALSSDWYWEQDDEFRYTNSSGHRFLPPSALLGKRRWETGAIPLCGDWSEHRAALEAHQPFRDFIIYRDLPHGERRYMSVDGEPTFDDQGRFTGYRGIVREITAAKREEQLLRLEHTVARSLAEADNAADAMKAVLRAMCETQGWECGHYWRVDEAAGVLRFGEAWSVETPAIQRFTEQSRAIAFERNVGLAGWVWQTGEPLWVPDSNADPRVFRKGITRETGMRGAFLFAVTVQGKTLGIVAFSSREVRKPDERWLQAVRVIGSQIGQFLQRKQAEEVLREREERFRSLTRLSSDWYWEQDGEFRFTWLSNEVEGRADATQSAAIGKAPWELGFVVPLSRSWDDHRRELSDQQPFRDFECAYVDGDGRPFHYVSISGLPIFDAAGRFCGYRGVGKDITQRKRTEERLVVHLNHQQLVAELGRRALLRKDLPALLDDAVRLLAQGLRVPHAALYELAPDGASLVLRAGTGAVHTDTAHPVPAGQCTPIGMALVAAAPTVTGDIENDPQLVAPGTPWADGLKSWMSVAVRGGTRPWGVLVAASAQTGAFGTDACAFIEAAASVLSSGLLRHESESRLAYLAQFDALTGLPNRTLVRDRLEHTIAQARRMEWLIAVLFVDLDRFKLVNDTLGHPYGDRLLAEVGRRLAACVRNADTVGRVSGDEFVVVLADLMRADDAGVVAQKIIDALSKPFVLDGHEAYVSASVGVALYPNDSDDAEALLRDADAAMYRAKESGRSAYCFFTAEMNARSRQRLQLQAELRRAVERDELRLVYQPKIDLASGRLCGLEALLRWQHPERGMVAPGEFISVLEETGLIVAAGEWVIRTACKQVSAWRAAGFEPVPIAVNVSARQFQLKDLDARIVALLRAANVEPGLLEIEITESYLAPDPQHAIQLLGNLQRAGIRVAIDDFGTGYSSLAYLTRFPVSSLKIERQFVRDATTDPSDAAIVRAVIDMANNLGFVVVAEGVETRAQAEFLQHHGCDQAQGYYFARPAPADEAQAWLTPHEAGGEARAKRGSRGRTSRKRRLV